jgi:hypothetical protein
MEKWEDNGTPCRLRMRLGVVMGIALIAGCPGGQMTIGAVA